MSLESFIKNLIELKTTEDIEDFINRGQISAIIKLGACTINDYALNEIQAVLGKYPDLQTGFIAVLKNRDASNYLTQKTSIRHETPQFFIFKDKECISHWSHFSIQKEKIDWALRELTDKK